MTGNGEKKRGVGRVKSEGRSLLVKRLAKASQERIAEQLGVSQQTVSSWALGTRRPGVEYRQRIEELLQIPLAAWLTNAEKKAREQFARRKAA